MLYDDFSLFFSYFKKKSSTWIKNPDTGASPLVQTNHCLQLNFFIFKWGLLTVTIEVKYVLYAEHLEYLAFTKYSRIRRFYYLKKNPSKVVSIKYMLFFKFPIQYISVANCTIFLPLQTLDPQSLYKFRIYRIYKIK